MFSLSISAWPHPIYLDSWTWHSRFLWNICFYRIRLYFLHQTHPHWASCLLWPSHFILSAAISNCLQSSSGAYWALSNLGAHLLMSYLFAFHIVHGVLTAWIQEQVALSSSSEPCFLRSLHSDLSILHPRWTYMRHAIQGMAHSFTELHKPFHMEGCDTWTGNQL